MESKAKFEWDRAHTTQIKMKLNNHTDADILEWFRQQVSKQGAIKNAIRKAIGEEKTDK